MCSSKEQRRTGISCRENNQQKLKAGPVEISGTVAPPLTTLGSSAMQGAEELPGAGREPGTGIILEKGNNGTISNSKSKMWPIFQRDHSLCNCAWDLAFPGSQFPDLQNKCLG